MTIDSVILKSAECLRSDVLDKLPSDLGVRVLKAREGLDSVEEL